MLSREQNTQNRAKLRQLADWHLVVSKAAKSWSFAVASICPCAIKHFVEPVLGMNRPLDLWFQMFDRKTCIVNCEEGIYQAGIWWNIILSCIRGLVGFRVCGTWHIIKASACLFHVVVNCKTIVLLSPDISPLVFETEAILEQLSVTVFGHLSVSLYTEANARNTGNLGH